MMKKLFLIAFIFSAGLSVNSQVTLQPAIPSVGLIQKSQLWNLIVVNSTNSSLDCRIELVLRDRKEGNEVLTATTSSFILTAGSKQLNTNNLGPIQYNYGTIGVDKSFNGILPIGNYIACYSLVKGLEKSQPIAEECVQFDVEALSPPMLIFPKDSAVLEIEPSQFSWIAPMPTGMFSKLNYEILIAEISEGQKAEEAIQNNTPVTSAEGLLTNVFTRNQSLTTLDKDKWYAWQIIARDNQNYAGKSETWVFKIRQESPIERILKGTPYVKMKNENPDMAIAPNGIIKLSYNNRLIDSSVTVTITDLSDKKPGSAQFIANVKQGENLIQYSLKKILKPSEEKTYMATIINSAGEKWMVLFKTKNFKD